MGLSKVTLVIVFNHKYNKNIPLLEELYSAKFSDIVYIVPFYKMGELNDEKYQIVSVYDTSYSFQGYIAQAYESLRKHDADYYLFIGDDLILHPEISENNFRKYFKLSEGESYNTEICKINEPFGKYSWDYSRVYHNLMRFCDDRFVNFRSEIPDKAEAFRIAEEKGYTDFTIDKLLYLKNRGIKGRIKGVIERKKSIPKEVVYPLFGGYSDLCIISGNDFLDFAHMAGVLAAIGVFAEIAIPTSMVLTCKKIKQQKDTDFERGDIWGMENKRAFGDKYGFSLKRLFASWPENILFIHPIKLSQWKN